MLINDRRFWVAPVLLVVCFAITASAQQSAVCYDATAGTLPQDQGWTFSGAAGEGGVNPEPVVAGGLLRTVATWGAMHWSRQDLQVDFTQRVKVEMRLRVLNSNYVPNIGTGTREGYYVVLFDRNLPPQYTVGLADGGFNLNSISRPNQALTPFVIADGEFHDYRFEVVAGQATFLIDGLTVASGVVPVNDAMNAGYYNVLFGPGAGRSRSETELEYFCYTAAPTLLAVGLDVKPGSLRNSINTTAEGKIPVAILSTPSFDAVTRTAIDSLRFGRTGDESSLDFCNGSGEDVNGDGLSDLVCHFSTPRTGLQLGDANAMLKGWTSDGIPIKGAEAIRVVR